MANVSQGQPETGASETRASEAGASETRAPETVARVLVVDDSPENRYVVRRALTRAGMEVTEAGTGAEGAALATAEPGRIDVIVLDVNLPDTTGFELCRRLKADPATADVPVIHLTQSAVDDGSRVRGLEGGADAYLTDPVHGSVLVATVRALLRVRRAEAALRQHVEDSERIAALNSRVAAASTEEEIITALVEVLNDPYTVRRAHLFAPRPWVSGPELIYPRSPLGSELVDASLPLSPERVDALIDAVFHHDGVEHHRIAAGQAGPYAWVLLPLCAYGREMGTLLIEFDAGIVLGERNQVRLAVAAERCAQAMERARLFQLQREIAAELQASLLPASLPEVAGLALAAEYRAGAERMFVGGDFYDVFPSTGGWTAIIGDVCGRGAAAAARTSLARHTAREAARHDDDPASVLSALETAIDADQRRDQLDLITAICLRLTVGGVPGVGGVVVRYAIAGHPLPLLIRAGGGVSTVGAPGPILGVDPEARFSTAALRLEPGDMLFLYTDGVVESRRSGVLFGEARLIALLEEMVVGGASVQELASAPIAAASAYNELHDDDMATLVIQAAPLG